MDSLMDQHAKRINIESLIYEERERQKLLVGTGKFQYTCSDAEMNDFERLSVLLEEVGEVAVALNEKDRYQAQKEIIQVAAVCIAWLESYDNYIRENYRTWLKEDYDAWQQSRLENLQSLQIEY